MKSGGRFRLGLGRAAPESSKTSRGRIQQALTRLKESIQIIRLLLKGERVDFNGDA
jgi:alkanesulfonate monooxygenase SsuD/methylene tetrahydromethanopterin reductase-like flavin-dependent oxidoreductase (luciferase family)